MNDDIKPCPFCGATIHTELVIQAPHVERLYGVWCRACGFALPLKRWQMRSQEPTPDMLQWHHGPKCKWKSLVDWLGAGNATICKTATDMKGVSREIKRRGWKARCSKLDGDGWMVKVEK